MARNSVLFLALGIPLSLPLCAQGVPAEWEIRDLALGLSRQMDNLAAALQKLAPERWEGASPAYAEQRELATLEAGYAAGAAQQLASEPKALSKAFELHLRSQSLEGMVTSLASGAKKYDDAEGAEVTLEALAAVEPGEAKLREYLVELAAWKEAELKTMDGETQRCRAEMLRRPGSTPITKPNKKDKAGVQN